MADYIILNDYPDVSVTGIPLFLEWYCFI